MKPTSGEWKVDELNGEFFVITNKQPFRLVIASLPKLSLGKKIPVEEAQANAHLIASAPDLLEACKELVAQIKQAQQGFERYINSPSMGKVLLQATQVIARATGSDNGEGL